MPRTITGTVSSNKMEKTASISVTRLRWSPLYRKQYKITKKYLAHDEKNQCEVGDKVVIEETRPTSKRKRWSVVEVVEKGPKV